MYLLVQGARIPWQPNRSTQSSITSTGLPTPAPPAAPTATSSRGMPSAANRRESARILWEDWSPDWDFDDATFDRSAAAHDNPDYVDVVIHSYRHRFGLAAGDPRYADLQRRLASMPPITVPAVTLDGDADGVLPAGDGRASASKFTSRRIHHIVPGAGHNVPQEAPEVFAAAVMEVMKG